MENEGCEEDHIIGCKKMAEAAALVQRAVTLALESIEEGIAGDDKLARVAEGAIIVSMGMGRFWVTMETAFSSDRSPDAMRYRIGKAFELAEKIAIEKLNRVLEKVGGDDEPN